LGVDESDENSPKFRMESGDAVETTVYVQRIERTYLKMR